MDQSLFKQFELARERGLKREAADLIQAFVAGFTSLDEREVWTRGYFENRSIGNRVNHVLFEQIIFPVLLDGYRRCDPWSLLMLDRCSQNLYSAQHLWDEVGTQSPLGYAEMAVKADPGNTQAKQRVLWNLIDWFRHAQHEWPWGILYGMNGATAEECEHLIEKVALARTLDPDGEQTDYLDGFEERLRQYLTRLSPQQP